MKLSLKLLYVLLERACHNYNETKSPFAKGRALVLVKEMHECLNDIEHIIRGSEDTEPLPAIREA
jgi:hypothetical protein